MISAYLGLILYLRGYMITTQINKSDVDLKYPKRFGEIQGHRGGLGKNGNI